MNKPYKEHKLDYKLTLREFDENVSSSELVWHRDLITREVRVLEGEGWQLQMDNEPPHYIQAGDVIRIEAETYHRLLKGTSKLVIEIAEGIK